MVTLYAPYQISDAEGGHRPPLQRGLVKLRVPAICVTVKQRLRRLERTFIRHPVYFVTACTHDRRHLLTNTAVHEAFLTFAQKAPERGAWVGQYVLMPDHFHLFVTLDDRLMALSPWIKSLKNTLSKAMRENGQPSPHWQKGFFDHVLRSEESASEKWAYVRENSIRAGLVSRAEDWIWSGEVECLGNRVYSL